MQISFGVVFLAGILTFFTPCILPLLPVYISLLVGEGIEEIARDRFKRASLFFNSFAFLLGITTVFTLLGLSATALGAFFLKNKDILRGLGGLLIFVFGLKFLGYLNVDFLDYEKRINSPEFSGIRILNSFLIGFFFAFGWSPCLGPVLGSILTYAAISTSNALKGAELLLIYSLGFSLPMLMLSLFMEPFLLFLRKVKKWVPVVEKVMGTILVLMGILLVINKASFLEFSISSPARKIQEKTVVCESQGMCKAPPSSLEIPTLPSQTGSITIPRGKPVLIEFYSPRCAVCMRMVPIVNALKRECRGENFVFMKVDIYDPGAREIVNKFGIFGTPTFVFLDKNGKEVARLLGYQELSSMLKTLKIIIPNGKCINFTKTQRE